MERQSRSAERRWTISASGSHFTLGIMLVIGSRHWILVATLLILAGGCAQPQAQQTAADAKAGPHAHADGDFRNQATTLTLIGLDGREVTVTGEDIAALLREEVTSARHEFVGAYSGPLLLDVLARVGVPPVPLRKEQQGPAVRVTAADGYQVVLGLGETDPATRADRIILADSEGGRPLDARNGPFMLVAEGDVRAARSPRMVVSIKLVSLGTSTER